MVTLVQIQTLKFKFALNYYGYAKILKKIYIRQWFTYIELSLFPMCKEIYFTDWNISGWSVFGQSMYSIKKILLCA